jgi:hypothetical protein
MRACPFEFRHGNVVQIGEPPSKQFLVLKSPDDLNRRDRVKYYPLRELGDAPSTGGRGQVYWSDDRR